MTSRRTVVPPSFMSRIRNWLLTGLLVLAPSAVTLWVFFRLLNWVDNLLGRYLRFAALDYHRIPGLGLLATLVLLIARRLASRRGSAPARSARLWDRLLDAHSRRRHRVRLDQVAGRGVPRPRSERRSSRWCWCRGRIPACGASASSPGAPAPTCASKLRRGRRGGVRAAHAEPRVRVRPLRAEVATSSTSTGRSRTGSR